MKQAANMSEYFYSISIILKFSFLHYTNIMAVFLWKIKNDQEDPTYSNRVRDWNFCCISLVIQSSFYHWLMKESNVPFGELNYPLWHFSIVYAKYWAMILYHWVELLGHKKNTVSLSELQFPKEKDFNNKSI